MQVPLLLAGRSCRRRQRDYSPLALRWSLIGIQRDQSKAYLLLSTFSAFARASLHLGRDSSGALLGFEPLYARGSSRVPLRIPRDGGGHVPLPEHFFYDVRWFLFRTLFRFPTNHLKACAPGLFPSFLDGGHGRHHYDYHFVIDIPPEQAARCVPDSSRILGPAQTRTISKWQLASRVSCPNLVLFYFILGVFAPQKLDRPQTASQVL